MISYPSSPDTPRSFLPFSPVVRVGELLFVSGQASVDDSGNVIADSFENEMRRSLSNMARILAIAGSDFAHVVQTRNYVRNAGDLVEYNRIYREHFREPFPARTTITDCLPNTLKYEIECVAVVRTEQR